MTVTTGKRPSGIRTVYRRTRFRSRLEARWAAFFDQIGWRWTYEPVDAAGYIPDFLVQGQASFFVEVGPCEYLSEFSAKAEKPLAAELNRPLLILGISPMVLDPFGVAAGYAVTASGTSSGQWADCPDCGNVGWVEMGPPAANPADVRIFQHRPCGYWAGSLAPDAEYLANCWARATNAVQWRGR